MLLQLVAEDISGSRGSHQLSDDSDVECPGKASRYMKDESECVCMLCMSSVRAAWSYNLADIPANDRAEPAGTGIQCNTKLDEQRPVAH